MCMEKITIKQDLLINNNEFSLKLPNNEIITCSKKTNSQLYKATVGGMGLTGLILDVNIKLRKIKSTIIKEKILKRKSY